MPRAETGDPAGLELVGIVTTDGDTVRFDRRRAGDPATVRFERPRLEEGEVRASVGGRSYRLPVERVDVWLHREPESNRTLLIASGIGLAAVGVALALVLGGGVD
ncbi:MAG: hypothetical protein R3326_00590 [Gemmatimonadota bacterium]|nr:hypothetical protein [Gemmatimonadota bacterium]